jgi:phosphate transport system permease protein
VAENRPTDAFPLLSRPPGGVPLKNCVTAPSADIAMGDPANSTDSDSAPAKPRGLSLSAPDPDRFTVSRGTLRVDRFMNRFIAVGGIAVILAVFGICFFILAEVLPLFQSPSVSEFRKIPTAVEQPLLLGADEWAEQPFILGADGNLTWLDLAEGGTRTEPLGLPADFVIESRMYHQAHQQLLLGSTDGRYVFVEILYRPVFAPDGSRRIDASVKVGLPESLGSRPIDALDFASGSAQRTVGLIERDPDTGSHRLLLSTYERKRTLFGVGDFERGPLVDLTGTVPADPVELLIGTGGQALVVRLADDRIAYFRRHRGEWEPRQVFRPFPEGTPLASMNFLQGEVSLSFTAETGENAIYSLTPNPERGLAFVRTKSLPPLDGGARHFAAAVRNKAYLVSDDSSLSLRYATTAKVRWETPLEKPLASILLGEKYDRIFALGTDGTVLLAELRDPHPEAGLRAFFGKLWYEGQDEARYTWQSTGGTDDFEPKLSLIPLIIGSLKGTFYALLFAVPIALSAAVYTSQFLQPSLKRIIKPTMEIMASLPSVVLGFIGALWLAPLLEDRFPSFLLLIFSIIGAAALVGYLWTKLSIRMRVLIPHGMEFVVFLPLLVLAGWVGWSLGPVLEHLVFAVTDPETGLRTADFRLWWREFSGATYQQRNSLIVGIMMGFAVIPIIFTIAEDSLSNVPQSLISGSLALGASRWQTAARVVLPSASAGIFSALMIGLGRAVGETMIMVMATGNTPIMSMDMFSGMRTLSANIAVELPEAPHGGTLYRTLFLGALVLFILTFAVNTFAESLRHRLRDKYKTIG